MRNSHKTLAVLYFVVFVFNFAHAEGGSTSSVLLYSVLGIIGMVALLAIFSLSDNLMKVEASKLGIDIEKKDIGVFPSINNLFKSAVHKVSKDGEGFHQLKKGFDLKLSGEATGAPVAANATRYAVTPANFRGISPIPKVEVEVGSNVKAGDIVMYDKKQPAIQYTAPVSGEVIEINRGDKRAIKEIVILADKTQEYKSFTVPSLHDQASVIELLLNSGAWTMFNQRPFDIVPAPNDLPRDIFISTFDSAPLAPNLALVIKGKEGYFQKGLDVLATLTQGSVYLGLDANDSDAVPAVFKSASGVKKHWFKGKHPYGNVGIQIHHIKPIKAGDKVWTLNVQEVATIGKLFTDGIYDVSRVIAVAGSRVQTPRYVTTFIGANVGDILNNNIKATDKDARIICGDVLTGSIKHENEFLDHHADQITVISEGDDYEPFGWLLPLKPRPTLSGTFPNFLYPNYKFDGDTNTHGEARAFVVTGQYEEVLPMDIYPQHLMKAIMAGDVEKMEGLGINELSEEDLAVCEFVCTSKSPLQKVLREGLDTMREEA